MRDFSGLICVLVVTIFHAASGTGKNMFRVAMPNVIPKEDDNYLCMAYPVTGTVFLKSTQTVT